ncbi:carbohydrate ABC transporter permease [Fimbriimonas ginsengisoli]|uniref:Sugar ABC transporter permease n=1 Tax=Fimbriimonas ginsengisoli Gsoil 348 TaxID=661478 RepID=A0A068NRE1_FIMGI|nr:sugar ABC transporter permease [Fimbriimonas ginsengisoli]AIE86078.1 sugar ABC transporter permease [Fimbriimonas ginsengisoli Gsoil 348]
MKRRDARVGVLFALPWIFGFSVFLAYPVIASFLYSFTSFSILRPPKWVGLSNYVELAHDDVFLTTLKNTLMYAVGAVPLTTVVAIGLAMLLNTKVKGMSLYRTLFFLPSLVPMVAQATLFLWIFNSDYGLLNEAFKLVHIPPPNWLGAPAWTKWTLILISTWGCGQAMVIYLAGLQDVPVSLYEAAELDGAKLWAKTRFVTIPMISPVILFNVIMGIIGSLQVFALPYVMFPGGQPARSTYFFTSYLFDNAFTYQRMGYASAMGWVMFLFTLALTLVSIKASERHVHYEAG